MPSPTLPDAPTRYAGLDGLRAIAVGLVVIYHLFPPAMFPGGFVGVDVFFVISGFLITSLLLRERTATGRIGLTGFWVRRARRLLPALALVVTVCASAAWIIGGDILVRLGAQVLGAFTFSYNWVSVAGDTGYFSTASPELFRNFWSLAVEEQFYVLWPLLLPLFLLLPRVWQRAGAALLLAAASATWMGVVVASGGVTRGYFGTDTHAFGILLGVALAFVMHRVLRPALAAPSTLPQLEGGWRAIPRPTASPPTRRTPTIVGAVALGGLAVVAFLPPTFTPWTFPGALLVASALTTVVIACAVWPRSVLGPALDRGVMKWVGDRSYGIYLWHWPLLVLVVAAVQGTGPEAGFSPWIGVVVLALTLVVSEVSYRLVETPIRRLGFRGTARRIAARFHGPPVPRLGAVAGVAAAALVIGGTSAAIAAAPRIASGEAAVADGAAALEEQRRASRTPTPTSTPTASPSATPTAAPTAAAEPSASPSAIGPLTAVPAPALEEIVVRGDQVTAVGDSVMLASAPALFERLPGIDVDAEVSRSAWAGPRLLEERASAGRLRPYVVVALGTNGSVDPGSLERMAQIAGPERLLVLVNAYAPRSWIDGVNTELARFAKAHPNVVVADWSAAIGPRPDLLAGDRIHPSGEGGRIFADLIATTLQTVEDDRAQRRYEAQVRLYENLRDRPVPRAE